jgi:hypothetical protein
VYVCEEDNREWEWKLQDQNFVFQPADYHRVSSSCVVMECCFHIALLGGHNLNAIKFTYPVFNSMIFNKYTELFSTCSFAVTPCSMW